MTFVTIEIADDFAVRAAQATDVDGGSNDDEHDLLVELIDLIGSVDHEFRRTYNAKLRELSPEMYGVDE